ncbi:MAG: protein NnrT [Pseudomonadota bacterium]
MRLISVVVAISILESGLAEAFDRPIPQAQSATAEFWYASACILLLVSMAAVHWLVSRR